VRAGGSDTGRSGDAQMCSRQGAATSDANVACRCKASNAHWS